MPGKGLAEELKEIPHGCSPNTLYPKSNTELLKDLKPGSGMIKTYVY